MDIESHIYAPDTLISKHTSRPANGTKCDPPIFWCDACQLRLSTPLIAMQHMTARSHNAKVNAKNKGANGTQNNALKQKRGLATSNTMQDGTDVQEPTMKKRKEQLDKSDPIPKCGDCNIEFDNVIIALEHYKGEKHEQIIAAKMAAKEEGNMVEEVMEKV